MEKRYLKLAVLLAVTGCAANAPETETASADDRGRASRATLAAAGPVETLDIAEFDQETVCEEIRPTGSRIVRGTRCYTRDANSAAENERRHEQVVAVQEALRREQEHLERMQREREMEMQRAMIPRSVR